MIEDLAKWKELKCRDCEWLRNTGDWAEPWRCELSNWPANQQGPACVSIKPKTGKI